MDSIIRPFIRQNINSNDKPMLRGSHIKKIIKRETGVESLVIDVVVDAMIRLLTDTLEEGRNISIRGFGTFYIKEKGSRKRKGFANRWDLVKGHKVSMKMIPAYCTIGFIPCTELKQKVKENIKPKTKK